MTLKPAFGLDARVANRPIADLGQSGDSQSVHSMGEDDPMLTELQAYAAMLQFLEAYWVRGGKASHDIASLLSSMQLAHEGTLDPAQWDDWKDAVARVLAEAS